MGGVVICPWPLSPQPHLKTAAQDPLVSQRGRAFLVLRQVSVTTQGLLEVNKNQKTPNSEIPTKALNPRPLALHP